MTTPLSVPGQATRPERRGADGGFFAVVCPQYAEDAANPDLRDLRTISDAYTTSSRHAVAALALLRDLDAFDRHLTSGALDAATHARFVEDRLRGAAIEPWLCAAGLARLVSRLLTHRRLQTETPTESLTTDERTRHAPE
jgi:hypothetical protein